MIKIKLADYIHHKSELEKQYDKFGLDSISLYSAVSGCPIIVCYSFVLPIAKDNDKLEIEKRIKEIMEFYGYKGVE